MVLCAVIPAQAPYAETPPGGAAEHDESCFGYRNKGKRGRETAGKVFVFGIPERDGLVHVQVVPVFRQICPSNKIDLTLTTHADAHFISALAST